MQCVFINYVLFIYSQMEWGKMHQIAPGVNGRGNYLKSWVNLQEANCLMEMEESLLNWGLGTLFSALKM
jgi:hypothetical protein